MKIKPIQTARAIGPPDSLKATGGRVYMYPHAVTAHLGALSVRACYRSGRTYLSDLPGLVYLMRDEVRFGGR